MVAKWGRYGRPSSCIQVSASPSRFFPLEAGMGLGQSYLAISRTFSMLVSESCMQLQPTEGPPEKVKFFCLPSLSVERSPDASQWHLGLLLGWGRGEWQGKSYFRGWTLLSTKPTIELSRSHLQSWGRDIFHPRRSSAVVCRLRNTPKHTRGKILKSPQEKYSKRNTPKHTEGGGQQSQHHARWKLHKARQPVSRVASFENIPESTYSI